MDEVAEWMCDGIMNAKRRKRHWEVGRREMDEERREKRVIEKG